MKSYLSLKYKLFLILVAISIVPIALVSYSSQAFMFRSSTQYTESIASQYVQFMSQDLSRYLQELSQSFDTLFTNSEFQKYLETPSEDLATQANYTIDFRPILKTPLQFRNEIVGVLYLDQLGKVYFESYQKELNYQYPFQKDPIYSTVTQTLKPELSVPHSMDYVNGSHENVFSFIRPIINLRTGQIHSWLVIEIQEDKINSMLRASEYGKEGQLLLFHATKGTAVANMDMAPSMLRDFKNALDASPGGNKEFVFTSSGTKYEATHTDIPYGDWKLVWLVPLSSITRGVEQAYRLTILIAVVSLAAALIIAFPVMNVVLKPLFKLKGGLQSLGRGSYVPIKIQAGNDEIGFVIQSYNQMLRDLQQMEQEVYQSKIKEKERELLQLQAQINPHFLFNTLETIESYALKNNGEAVGDMVQSVSRMMRYNVRNDGGWAPLKEEIAYIRNFLTIHYYRNGMEVRANVDIDPAAQDIPLMKLSIQPFVENAIKYGWSPHKGPDEFCLNVQAELQEDALHLTMSDTGSGMDPVVLDKISAMIASKGEAADPFFQKHTGIYNVYRRFLLAYGEQFEFKITSQPGKGTVVEMWLPYRSPSGSN
jgi:sensor histidine kinase YesM